MTTDTKERHKDYRNAANIFILEMHMITDKGTSGIFSDSEIRLINMAYSAACLLKEKMDENLQKEATHA